MERGFLGSLFDFSFSSFITTRLIKIIYALFIGVSGFVALFFVIGAFASSTVLGLFTLLIAAPVLFFFYVILARVYLELVVAIFRIAENTSVLAGRGHGLADAPGPFAGPAASEPAPAPPPPAAPAPEPTPAPEPPPPAPPAWESEQATTADETAPIPPSVAAPTSPAAPPPPPAPSTEPEPEEPTTDDRSDLRPPAMNRPRRRAPLRPRRDGPENPPAPPR